MANILLQLNRCFFKGSLKLLYFFIIQIQNKIPTSWLCLCKQKHCLCHSNITWKNADVELAQHYLQYVISADVGKIDQNTEYKWKNLESWWRFENPYQFIIYSKLITIFYPSLTAFTNILSTHSCGVRYTYIHKWPFN